jgi:hypothetical protein
MLLRLLRGILGSGMGSGRRESQPPAGEPDPDPIDWDNPEPSEELDPETLELFNGQARVVEALFTEAAGRPLPPGREGIAFLSGFIDRHRLRLRPGDLEAFVEVLGPYLGAAMVAEFDGRWIDPCLPKVEITPNVAQTPFGLVQWHFEDGEPLLEAFDLWLLLYGSGRRSA